MANGNVRSVAVADKKGKRKELENRSRASSKVEQDQIYEADIYLQEEEEEVASQGGLHERMA